MGGEGATRSRRGGRGGPGVCNSNGQIVIAERFDRWIMTSNDTPRWESKPPPIPPRARRERHHPPRRSPFLPALARSSPRHVLPPPHHGGADVDMRLRHAYAAAFGIGLCAANHRRET